MKKCPKCQRQYPDQLRFCADDNSPLYHEKTVYPGATVSGKYRVESVIKIAGMSTVYLVEHLFYFNEKMAMKVMSPDCAQDSNMRKRFENEALIMRQLEAEFGRNIAKVKDIGQTEDGLPYVVMEYIRGEALSVVICPDDYAESRRPLDIGRALNIAKQVCDVLDAAHRNKIIHRDIKPENILLIQGENEEVVKVIDFGIASFPQARGNSGKAITQEDYLGSPHYSSPEQVASKTGSDIDARSDIYSLGVVLYEMLTGQQPFSGETDDEVLDKQLHATPPPADGLNPMLPPALVALTMKALAKAPLDRFQSAKEMRLALEQAPLSLDGIAPDASREYVFSFETDRGLVEFSVPIALRETLNSITGELLGNLRSEGLQIKYYQSGPLLATWNGSELDPTIPLAGQGVPAGGELRICSPQFRAKLELETWLEKSTAPEEFLVLSPEAVAGCRERFAAILQSDPDLERRIAALEQSYKDVQAIKDLHHAKGVVAALSECERRMRTNPSLAPFAGGMTAAYIDDLSSQLTDLIDRRQFNEASELLFQIDSTTDSKECFALMSSRLQTEMAIAEGQLRELVELAALGSLELSRAIADSFAEKPPQFRNGLTVSRLFEQLNTLPDWLRTAADLLKGEQWREAKAVLEDRADIFGIWPPFSHMMASLNGLERVRSLSESSPQLSSQPIAILAESGILDLRWTRKINFDAATDNSLAQLAQRILSVIGQKVRSVESQQTVIEEGNVRRFFFTAVRDLAKRDPAGALRELNRALAVDPDPQLLHLKSELGNV